MAGRFTPKPTRTTVRGGHTVIPQGAPAGPTTRGATRSWTPEAPEAPLDLGLTLGPLRRGPADPTFRTTPAGLWRASRTPEGPATIRITTKQGTAHAESWGPGAAWMLDQLPHLLGQSDTPDEFEPHHRLVAQAQKKRQGLRLTRTGLVLESLIPSILEQKVTTDEAYRAWRLLVRKHGEPAPGPAPDHMYVMPDPQTWRMIPSWEWHRAGVDNKRASTILRAVRVANRLEEAAAMEPEQAQERLELIPGIGPWTSAEVVQRSNGAPDAVTVGDLHLPHIIGYALTGAQSTTDERMLELLAPYKGQRHRAARYILLAGRTPPRRTPKMPKADIARL